MRVALDVHGLLEMTKRLSRYIRPSEKNVNVYRPRPRLFWGPHQIFFIFKIEEKPHALLSLCSQSPQSGKISLY